VEGEGGDVSLYWWVSPRLIRATEDVAFGWLDCLLRHLFSFPRTLDTPRFYHFYQLYSFWAVPGSRYALYFAMYNREDVTLPWPGLRNIQLKKWSLISTQLSIWVCKAAASDE
jgi:hypothetical protein